jgi:hypothetical protein
MSLLRKRVLRVFGIIVVCLVWEVGLIFSLAFVGDHFPDGDNLIEMVFYAGNILIPILLVFYRSRRRDQWIEEEAENWFAFRTAQAIAPRKKGHRIFWRIMLWTPSLIALSVFLFLPEAMGIISHTFDLQTHDLNDHRVHLPLTSFVRSYKGLYVSALVGRGIGRVGLLPYLRKEPPLSSLFFYAVSDPSSDHSRDWILTDERIHSRRTLVFGSEMITCANVPSHHGVWETNLLNIQCRASKNDVYAGFYALDEDVDIFYEALKNSSELPTIRIFRSIPSPAKSPSRNGP